MLHLSIQAQLLGTSDYNPMTPSRPVFAKGEWHIISASDVEDGKS